MAKTEGPPALILALVEGATTVHIDLMPPYIYSSTQESINKKPTVFLSQTKQSKPLANLPRTGKSVLMEDSSLSIRGESSLKQTDPLGSFFRTESQNYYLIDEDEEFSKKFITRVRLREAKAKFFNPKTKDVRIAIAIHAFKAFSRIEGLTSEEWTALAEDEDILDQYGE